MQQMALLVQMVKEGYFRIVEVLFKVAFLHLSILIMLLRQNMLLLFMLQRLLKSLIEIGFGWNVIHLLWCIFSHQKHIYFLWFFVPSELIVFILFASIDTQISHIFKKGNKIADTLSKIAISSTSPCWSYSLLASCSLAYHEIFW